MRVVLREAQSEKANLISWRSAGSDRKPWSSLAAETHVAQVAMGKAIHIQNLCEELGWFILRTVVLTDDLSLRRVLYNRRRTKETRLRREIASIRNMIVRDGIQLRDVPSEEVLADPLTKSMDGTKLLKIGGQNKLNRIEIHDCGKTTEKDLVEANKIIEMETLSERLEKIKKEYEAKRIVKQSGTMETSDSSRLMRRGRKRTSSHQQQPSSSHQ